MALLRKVFVYGTLKHGQPNHHILGKQCVGKATLMGQGRTLGKFPMVLSEKFSYPFLLDKEGSGKKIIGEVYEVDMDVFAELDELEGYPDLYQRREIQIEVLDGAKSNFTEADTDSPPGVASVLLCYCYMKQNYQAWHLVFPHIENYDINKVMDYLPKDDPRRKLDQKQLVDGPMTD